MKTVSIGGYSIMSVVSGSMEPTYKIGDVLVVKKADVSSLEKGDIITFRSEDPNIFDYVVTHRIHQVNNENGSLNFTTKGDNNMGIDEYSVSSERVIGTPVMKIPSVGKLAVFLQTNKLAFFGIVILPMLLIIAFEIKDIVLITHSNGEDEDETEKDNR